MRPDEMVGQRLIDIVAAAASQPAAGDLLEDAVMRSQHRDVEGAAAEVVDQHP